MELDDFQTLVARYDDVLRLLERHEIPEEYPPNNGPFLLLEKTSLDMGSQFVRDRVIELAGYSFVAYKWIRPLAAWIAGRRCLEVMGGSGALSKGLQNCGVNILCTDNYAWMNQRVEWFKAPWTKVEQLDGVEAIHKYGKDIDIVICSWPYLGSSCYDVLSAMRAANPDCRMIYIGENNSDVNADEQFFEKAIHVRDPSFEAAVAGYRTAHTIHDWPVLLK